MKYSLEIEINLPRAKVIELFDDVENLKYWQDGFVSFEHLSGILGEVGSTARLRYLKNKKEIILIETILKKNLPEAFAGTYETKGIWNQIENYFIMVDKNTTRWVSDCEFKFYGWMRIMSFFMPTSIFKKQSLQFMTQFKAFAES